MLGAEGREDSGESPTDRKTFLFCTGLGKIRVHLGNRLGVAQCAHLAGKCFIAYLCPHPAVGIPKQVLMCKALLQRALEPAAIAAPTRANGPATQRTPGRPILCNAVPLRLRRGHHARAVQATPTGATAHDGWPPPPRPTPRRRAGGARPTSGPETGLRCEGPESAPPTAYGRKAARGLALQRSTARSTGHP